MKNEINFKMYVDYFHDGYMYGINKENGGIAISMSSAEIDLDIAKGKIVLSKDNSIKGILHLSSVKKVHISDQYDIYELFSVFDRGVILDFEITGKSVEFGILWENFPPKSRTNEFSNILIESEKIWWENIPDLEDRSSLSIPPNE